MGMERKGIRAGTRIPIELPVQIRWKSPGGIKHQVQGKTGNISGNGLFILVPVRLRHDTPIDFTVSLPVQTTKVPTQLRCQGRVVRRYSAGAMAGIAVVIDDYKFCTLQKPA